MPSKPFYFKQFVIEQDQCAMKIGTDGVLLGAWCNSTTAKTILDIGTGTGIIAIMQAQRNKGAHIDALEIDVAASQQAQINFKQSPWSNRLSLQNIPLQVFTKKTDKTYDHIISNPPFYPLQHFTKANGNQRATARNTIHLSYKTLLYNCSMLMHLNSKLSLVIPSTEFISVKQLAIDYGLYLTRLTNVFPKKYKVSHRMLLEFSRINIPLISGDLTIQYEKRNDFTPEYISLTKDFYTIL